MDYEMLDGLPNKPKDETPWVPEIRRVNTLSELDLEQELLDRYYDCRVQLQKLQNSIGQDKDQTTAMNSLMGIMRMIVTMKTDLYNVERQKKLEETLIDMLQEWPDMREAFLVKYKERLDEL